MWPQWGVPLTVLGMVSAFYGVMAGITQSDPKSVLGWSSVSQMGVIATALGMGLASGDHGIRLPVACYAVNHTLVKGGLFVAIGVAQAGDGRRRWTVLLPAAVLALGLGGLPLTGGWLAKLVVKPVLGGGTVGLLASLSSAGTTLLMIHFLARLAALPAIGRASPAAARWAWLGLALAAMAIPWLIVAALIPGALAGAASLGSMISAGWPVLLGAALAAALSPWRHRLMRLNDAGALVPGIARLAARLAATVGTSAERLDLLLRRWPVATNLLLILATLMAALLLVAG
jgi:formate hydrogenlyase subunit 3/multisubunit Na+/H+ antiporter MnhD subunit